MRLNLLDALIGPPVLTGTEAMANLTQMQAAQHFAMIHAMVRGCAFTIEPGIFWERTGGKTHRVTIRREAELVPDWSRLGCGP